MKVLLLGMNYASTMNSALIGLRSIGIDAKSVSFELNRSIYNDFEGIIKIYPLQKKLSKISFKKNTVIGLLKLIRLAKNADVIHLFSDIQLHTRFQPKFENYLFNVICANKPKFITFVGSEVRIPSKDFADNSYYKEAFEDPKYEYKNSENELLSNSHQKRFYSLGFKSLTPPDICHYLNPNYFSADKIIHHAGVAKANSNFTPHSPLKIVHAPTAPIAKGTKYVIDTIKELTNEGYKIDFTLLQNLNNNEYQQAIDNCDIYVDQFVWGWHGVAAIQALAMSKPVIAYLHPKFISHTINCPIINCEAINLKAQLLELILQPELLNSISKESFKYYTKYHSPSSTALILKKYYIEND